MPDYSKVVERMLENVIADEQGCWIWQGHTRGGYGRILVSEPHRFQAQAHRVMYESVFGAILSGLEIDHVCHNHDKSCAGGECKHRRCVNPLHLEAVTHAQNGPRSHTHTGRLYARKTHCPLGHPYSGDNLYLMPKANARACRACRANASRRYRDRKRVAAARVLVPVRALVRTRNDA